MSTNTANYNLVKPSGAPGGDLVDIAVINSNMDIIDAGMQFAKLHGVQICTSGARPATGLFAGMIGFETDTQRYIWYDGSNWRCLTRNLVNANLRVWSATNTFNNQTVLTTFPVAADRTSLTTTLSKVATASKLLVNMYMSVSIGSGVAQRGFAGIRIAGTDYTVASHRFLAATSRDHIIGQLLIPGGVAAGNLTIEPLFASETAAQFNFFTQDDTVSYSVEEI